MVMALGGDVGVSTLSRLAKLGMELPVYMYEKDCRLLMAEGALLSRGASVRAGRASGSASLPLAGRLAGLDACSESLPL